MTFFLEGWTGDNAGPVVGREPYRALIRLVDDGTLPWARKMIHHFLEAPSAVAGIPVPVFSGIEVRRMTAAGDEAWVTEVKQPSFAVYSLKLTQPNFGKGEVAWEPGVHLFSIRMFIQDRGLTQAAWISCFATIVVPSMLEGMVDVSPLAASELLQLRGGQVPQEGITDKLPKSGARKGATKQQTIKSALKQKGPRFPR